jgi:hypothetical protein
VAPLPPSSGSKINNNISNETHVDLITDETPLLSDAEVGGPTPPSYWEGSRIPMKDVL